MYLKSIRNLVRSQPGAIHHLEDYRFINRGLNTPFSLGSMVALLFLETINKTIYKTQRSESDFAMMRKPRGEKK